MREHARNGGCLATVPPSAAQDHRESEARGQDRRSAARCAAVPVPAVQTRQTAGLAALRRALLQSCRAPAGVCVGEGREERGSRIVDV